MAPRSGGTIPSSRNPTADHDRWPVIWRVVVPAGGSYHHDMVYLETEDARAARRQYAALRRERGPNGWPVRLERVQCGPLPPGAKSAIRQLRKAGDQLPGSTPRQILGFWTQRNREAAHE